MTRWLFFIGFLTTFIIGCGAAVGAVPSYLVYVRDAQGSVVAAVDDTGSKIWETHDDAFGLRLSSSGTVVPREFLDQPLDEETGFYAFEYRMFDPQSAQWLSPDPRLTGDPGACAENPQKCNPYAYGGDRPGEWIDRDGRWADSNYRVGSQSYQAITLAFVGADSVNGANLVAQAIDRSNKWSGSTRPILSDVRAYADPSQAPPSFTRVVWASDSRTNGGRSSFDPATSTITLRGDARDSDHMLDVINHEIQHAMAANERYNPLTMKSFEGFEHSIMGNFWQQSGVPQLTAPVLQEEDSAKAAGQTNLGLTAPNPAEWQFPGGLPSQPSN